MLVSDTSSLADKIQLVGSAAPGTFTDLIDLATMVTTATSSDPAVCPVVYKLYTAATTVASPAFSAPTLHTNDDKVQ